jgi:hypothetical protein
MPVGTGRQRLQRFLVSVMSADDKGPTWRVPRPSGHQDRDRYTEKHTPRTPARGVPDFVEEECTGKYDGDELAVRRRRRSTEDRVGRIEIRLDGAVTKLDKMEGMLETLVSLGERQAKHLPATIKALGVAIAVIIAAALGKGVL